MIDTAVILAAGLGSRLKDRTNSKPKGFLVLDKEPIIEESVSKLRACGIKRILIGTGYLSEVYEEFAGRCHGITCIKNPDFASTGSMYTLYNMKDSINNDFLLLESDLIYDKSGIDILMSNTRKDVILGSGQTNSGDEVYIEVNEKFNLVNMSKKHGDLKSVYAELVGISKISVNTFQKMCTFAEDNFKKDPKLDYEYTMVGISKDTGLFVKKIEDFAWCEIDDEDHLKRAANIIYPRIKENEGTKSN